MRKVCAIESCTSGRGNENHDTDDDKPRQLSYFSVGCPTKLKRWSKSSGLNLKITDYICQLHFKKNYIKNCDQLKIRDIIHFSDRPRKYLLDNALPTIKHQSKVDDEQQQPVQVPANVDVQEQSSHYDYVEEQQRTLHDTGENHQELVCEQTEQESSYSLNELADNIISSYVLPKNWYFSMNPYGIYCVRFNPVKMRKINELRINNDMSITIICSNNQEENINEKLTSIDDLYKYLKHVEKWPLCVGTQMEKMKYSPECKGVVFGKEKYIRRQRNPRCYTCRKLRRRFLMMILRNIRNL